VTEFSSRIEVAAVDTVNLGNAPITKFPKLVHKREMDTRTASPVFPLVVSDTVVRGCVDSAADRTSASLTGG